MSNLLYKNRFINPDISESKVLNNYQLEKDLYKEDVINLDKERVEKEKVTILNIDSRDRRINPKNIYDTKLYRLENNPFEFTLGTNKIIVNLPNHNFNLNDKVSIGNVVGRQTTIKHKLILYEDSAYAKILDNEHNLTYEYSQNKKIYVEISNVQGNLVNGIKTTILSGIPINFFNRRHEVLFQIPDTVQDKITEDTDYINLKNDIDNINNIQISELNNIQTLESKLENILINEINPLDNIINNKKQIINKLIPNFFLIKLPKEAEKDYDPIPEDVKDYKDIDTENTNVKLHFLHLFGISLNLINADFPLTVDRKQGSHVITRIINNNQFEICVNDIIIEPRQVIFSNNYRGGGSCVNLSRVINSFTGYPYPNHYKISLRKNFYNVKKVELIGSIFPNTERVFRDRPTSRINNKLYWNILDDGDELYSIEIVPGNYSPSNLQTEIQNKIFLIDRNIDVYNQKVSKFNEVTSSNIKINTCESTDFKDPDDEFKFNSFERKTIIVPKINTTTSQVEFSAYERIYVQNAIGGFDDIDSNFDSNCGEIGNVNLNNYSSSFVVAHPNHPYNSDDIGNVMIKIDGAGDIKHTQGTTNGTYPKSNINTLHTLIQIIDAHRYRVSFDNSLFIEAVSSNATDFGGDNIIITYPIKFRMLFDKEDTMGKELGFNKVGEEYSITPFKYTITNYDLYDIDTDVNTIGIPDNRKHNVINLCGENYFLMTSKVLANFKNTGLVNDIFAKIQIDCPPDNYLYNTYINTPKIFDDPVDSLEELEFRFYNYDGTLVNFNGAEHSFSLKITELINLPDETHINTRTGAKLQTFI